MDDVEFLVVGGGGVKSFSCQKKDTPQYVLDIFPNMMMISLIITHAEQIQQNCQLIILGETVSYSSCHIHPRFILAFGN